jgi:phage-related protein
VFDNASLSQARKAFANLDNLVSRDAMQRLRGSPQGSVLGALNALFSPHPVTGAPSPQQAAARGMLGQVLGPQGGGNIPVSGRNGGSVNVNVGGGGGTTRVVQQGGGDSQALRDAARDIKGAASDVKGSAGDIGRAADDMHGAATDLREASTGIRGVVNSLHHLFGTGGGGGRGGGAGDAARFGKNLAGGIGPSILGLPLNRAVGFAGLGALGLAGLPALLAPALGLGVGGAGLGLVEAGAKQLIGQKNTKANPNAEGPLYQQAQQIKKTLQDTMQSAAGGMLGSLKQAFAEIPGLLKGIEPALKQAFAGAGTLIQPALLGLSDLAKSVLPALGQAFRAAAPLLRPLIDGISQLLKGLLPGITTLLKAAGPAVQAFGKTLGTIGRDLGKMFTAMAPAIKASVQVLTPLLDLLGALFPIIGKLAAVFAQALGPVFAQFAAVIKSLLPFLSVIGKLVADLASAMLADLVAAFTAVARLLKDIAPSLTAFANALSGVFTLLENSGVFATLGDALENIVPLIANLVNAILKGLTPVLPPVIQALSQISSIMVGAFTQALSAVLPPLTQLATVVLQALADILPVILPVLTAVLGAFTAAGAGVITAVADALSALLTAIPPGVLQAIVIGLAGLKVAFLALSVVPSVIKGISAALDLLAANPVGAVALAVVALGVAFYEAWHKSAGFRQAIKDIGAGFVEAGVIIVQVAKTITDAILSTIGTILHGLADAFGWVPGLGSALRGASRHFDDFKGHVDNGFNDMIRTMTGWRDQLTGAKATMADASASIIDDMTRAGYSTTQAKQAVDAYTTAVQRNGEQSSQARQARRDLIADLEASGLNAQQATKLVDGLGSSILALHGKSVKIVMTGDGTYSITQANIAALNAAGGNPKAASLSKHAAGGYIFQGTTGTADDVPIMASKGEYVVKASSVQKYGTGMMDAINAGRFAQGGMVGQQGNLTPAYITGMYGDFQKQMTDAMVSAMRASVKAAKSAAEAAAGGAPGSLGGPASAGASAAQAYARSRLGAYGWGGGQMGPLILLWDRESGWNRLARNPSSGAYGIPQALPPSKMGPEANPPTSSAAAQINWGLGYIKGRYGSPAGAWAHEVAQGWYASGGLVGDGIMPWWRPGSGGPGGGLGPVLSGASGGSANPVLGWLAQWWLPPGSGAGTPAPGGTAGAGVPSGGGFGLTRADLGLPATTSSGGGGGGGAGGGAGGGTGVQVPVKKKKAIHDAARQAAIAVAHNLFSDYLYRNRIVQARQAVSILDWLGFTQDDSKLSEVSFLDRLLLSYRQHKNKRAEAATERLLAGYGVHTWIPQASAKGNAPAAAVIARVEGLMRGDIAANNLTAAHQANAILTHLGVGRYSPVLAQIANLDNLLATAKKHKNRAQIAAIEDLLRTYGVRKFAQGGTLWEPVVGFGMQSGGVYQFAEHGPEDVMPRHGGGGDMAAKLDRLCMLMERQNDITAAIPAATGDHVGAAFGGAGHDASFRRRYPQGGW